jgi:phage-related tail protein
LQLEGVTKSNQELTAVRARLTQENSELHRQLQDIEAKYSSVSQLKTQIQQKFDAAQAKLDEQHRVSKNLSRYKLAIIR